MRKVIEFKPRAELLIKCLTSEYQWLELLKGKNKKYDPLLHYLAKLGEEDKLDLDNYDRKNYQSSGISKATGVKPTNVKKYLTQIYEDILTLNYDNPELFKNGNNHRYLLHFSHLDHCYSNFNIWLPTELNRFDRFTFSFIQGKVDCGYFWVRDILHIHEYGDSKSFVYLVAGSPNIYRELLLDKADFLREISFDEKYSLSEYQMDEKLKLYGRREKL